MSTDLLTDVNKWLKAHGHQAWSDKLLGSRFGGHDELTRHHVTRKRRRRRDPGAELKDGDTTLARPRLVSRFPSHDAEPGQYRAWVGMRFRTDEDDVTDAEADNETDEDDAAGSDDADECVTERDNEELGSDTVTLVTGIPVNQSPV